MKYDRRTDNEGYGDTPRKSYPHTENFRLYAAFSIPLGLVVAALKMCRFKPISWLTNLYILIMRGTPLMLQIIVVYYALPFLKTATKGSGGFVESLLSGVDPAAESFMFTMVIIAFVLNYAAYLPRYSEAA